VNILIVEDDAFYLDTITKVARGWAHDVTCAESGRAALDKAAAMDFDLFLLDVFLPDMTAMDFIPRLRAFRPDARIITLTGQSTRELERELRELGIVYYMAKPVSQQELKCILDHMSRLSNPPIAPGPASLMADAS
jgi:DNA-binding response OmpR family regulator